MIELAQQLAVIMVGKQIINNAQEIIIPKVKAWWHNKKVSRTRSEFRYELARNTLVQLNEYETDRYFLQNFQCMTLLIHAFCKICEHEIVLQEGKSKQKQFQVHNSYKTRE